MRRLKLSYGWESGRVRKVGEEEEDGWSGGGLERRWRVGEEEEGWR